MSLIVGGGGITGGGVELFRENHKVGGGNKRWGWSKRGKKRLKMTVLGTFCLKNQIFFALRAKILKWGGSNKWILRVFFGKIGKVTPPYN